MLGCDVAASQQPSEQFELQGKLGGGFEHFQGSELWEDQLFSLLDLIKAYVLDCGS